MCVCGHVLFQLVYQSVEWKGHIAIEMEPANLSLAMFETTKDGEKRTMVSQHFSIQADMAILNVRNHFFCTHFIVYTD